MLAACIVPGSDTELVWVADERLLAAGVDEEALPLWIRAGDRDSAGFMRVSGARAVAAGLRHRPLAETARDVLALLRPGDRLALDATLEARLVR
jgi:hypothetical protein